MTYFIQDAKGLVEALTSKDVQDLVSLLKNPKSLDGLKEISSEVEILLKQKKEAQDIIRKSSKLQSELAERELVCTKLEQEIAEKNKLANEANEVATNLKAQASRDSEALIGKLKEADSAKVKAENAIKRTEDKQAVLDSELAKVKSLQEELAKSISSYNNALDALKAAKVA